MSETSFVDLDGTLAGLHALPVAGPVSAHHPGEARAKFVVGGFAGPGCTTGWIGRRDFEG